MIRRLCAEVAPASLDLVTAFGIPEYLISTPIASDWVEYNVGDNQVRFFSSFCCRVVRIFIKEQSLGLLSLSDTISLLLYFFHPAADYLTHQFSLQGELGKGAGNYIN
jgi:hypothetical protein